MSYSKLLIGLVSLLLCSLSLSTPLDDYVWKADDNYKWEELPEFAFEGKIAGRAYKAHVLNMTSQRWLTDDAFSPTSPAKSIWWHYLVVIVPEEVKWNRNASLWITGGSMGDSPPKASDEDIRVSAALATYTGMVMGALFQIPNERVTFSADPEQRSLGEDGIIAYTWDHYLKDVTQPEWLLRFPMVKASLRAMDTVTAFMKTAYPDNGFQLDYYAVSGASKRGWTTWLVGAVDTKRVVAIIPIVLDAINFVKFAHHQFRSYGAWTYALSDYTEFNITERLDGDNMKLLCQNVDPYFYRHRLTMPKLVINAAMDEFQEPDDTHYWWSDMPHPKHFVIIPNAEHSLASGIQVAVPTAGAFLLALLNKDAVPTFDWTIDSGDGSITATVNRDGVVHEANVWFASSCGVNHWDNDTLRRDYRIAHLDNPCTCGIFAEGYCVNLKTVWNKKSLDPIEQNGKKTYHVQMDPPSGGGWIAFFIELRFYNKNAFSFDVTGHWDNNNNNNNNNESDSEKTKLVKLREKLLGGKDRLPNFGGLDKDFGRFFLFTTEVSIWPNSFPYPDCSGLDCGVRLV